MRAPLKVETIEYAGQDMACHLSIATTDCPHEWTRMIVAKLLGESPEKLLALSRTQPHIRIYFHADQDRYQIVNVSQSDVSLNGKKLTDAVRDGIIVGRAQLRIFARAEAPILFHLTDPDTVGLEELPGPATVPVIEGFAEELWRRLAAALNTPGLRAAHLYGQAGVGKTTFVEALVRMEPPWPRIRQTSRLQDLLVARVDGRTLSTDMPLWRALAYQILVGLEQACIAQSLPGEASETINSAFRALENLRQPAQVIAPLLQALLPVVANRERRVLLLFDNFDAPYRELSPDVLAALADLHGHPHLHHSLCYLLVSQRQLADLRADTQTESVHKFNQLFPLRAESHFQLKRLDEASFRRYLPVILPDTNVRTDDIAPSLFRLSGGNLHLAKVIWEQSGAAARSPEEWPTLLPSPVAGDGIHYACLRIWRGLSSKEQDIVKKLANGASLNEREQKLLRRCDLLAEDNSLFSPIFAAHIPLLAESLPGSGLRVTQDGRIFLDDREISNEVTGIGRRILCHLLEHAQTFCTYEDLVAAGWSEKNANIQTNKAALQKQVNRIHDTLRKIRPDGQFIENVPQFGYKLNPSP